MAETAAEEFDPYLVEQVFNDVIDALHREKNYSEEVAKKLLYTGGYQIYATIDPELQSIVEKVYADTSNLPYTSSKGEQLQSGMTVIDNATGNIVAMAGRVGEREGRFLFNYATATRPCGSAIKPIAVYAPALDTGVITPATVLDDYPVRLQANENGTEKAWPKNSYSGYKGLITLQTALRVSTNTTAVRVLEALSPSVSYDFMTQNLGFTTLVNSDLNSAALGLGGLTYGVNTVEMAAAYSAFANNGVYTRPRTYIEVRDNKGSLVLENKQESWVAMKESTAYSINELLKGVVRSGTGTEAAFSGMTIAGKTGTTSSNYDRYFVGYTPYYTAAVEEGHERGTREPAQSEFQWEYRRHDAGDGLHPHGASAGPGLHRCADGLGGGEQRARAGVRRPCGGEPLHRERQARDRVLSRRVRAERECDRLYDRESDGGVGL